MNIVEYTSDLLPQLTVLINRHIDRIPPGWMLNEAQVATILSDAERFWSLHFGEDEQPSPAHIPCAVDGERLLAAAQWDEWTRPDQPDVKIATVIWIVAEPDQPEALDRLLSAIIGKATELNCCQIVTSRFRFGVGWMGIPTQWQHLINGMLRANFQVSDKWVMMTASSESVLMDSTAVAQPTLKWNIREGNLEWDVEAYADGKLAGECQAWGIPTYYRGCRGYEEWMTVEWLGVEESFRRQGIGRLLMLEQLRFHARRGVKNVIVWTETHNREARMFNRVLGFEYGPECWNFERLLDS